MTANGGIDVSEHPKFLFLIHAFMYYAMTVLMSLFCHGLQIQRLSGMDSDFAPFVQHAGVASVDMYYGKGGTPIIFFLNRQIFLPEFKGLSNCAHM